MRLKRWLAGSLMVLVAAAAQAAESHRVASDNVSARLVSEVASVAPGKPFWVSLELEIRDGWHTYWLNPGDSGQATRMTWSLPPGANASEIEWASPHRFELPPLVNYGYAGHASHLIKITPPSAFAAAFTLTAKARWLVCSDVCIPEDGVFELRLPKGDGGLDPSAQSTFEAARAGLPRAPLGGAAATLAAGALRIRLDPAWQSALAAAKAVEFFPLAAGVVLGPAVRRAGTSGEWTMRLGDTPLHATALAGVLRIGAVAYELRGALDGAAHPVVPGAGEVGEPRAANDVAPPLSAGALALYALFAVLGGLVLNLMPCVFPVLSIKALGLVEQSKKHPEVVRRKGLLFAAGVVGSMWLLAASLLALRAGGEQVGWGFQLQSPVFVALMVYLLMAVGLNLSGVFEFGGSLAGVGDSLTRGEGYRASFFTGVLTTLVATPCTAPFMGAAVGAALSQPAAIAIIIFTALGFGLSLPYLLISFAPALRSRLPRPGMWMETLKQFFAFPMYASAAWLMWVFAQQTGPGALAAILGGTVLIAFTAWIFQRAHTAQGAGRWVGMLVAVTSLVCAIALPLYGVRTGSAPQSLEKANAEADWRPYHAAEVASLVAAGKTVLVNFTADWCLTCLVNERNAFGDAGVQAMLRQRGVVLVKGDWTRRNEEITQALARFGRAGVPLYVLYNARPDATEPVVLPQLLTPGIVRDALAPAMAPTAKN